MSTRLRLGIVGCGEIARYVAFLARLNPRIQVRACCDLDLDTARSFSARYGIPVSYAAYEALLEKEDLDAVYLAVPHDLHAPLIAAAVQNGRHVLCEKPLAGTWEEGQEIARLARAAGVRVGVNYQYRYDSGCYALAAAAQQGDLGKLLYGRCNTPWQREAAYFERSRWRGEVRRAGGGTLLTQGSHALDVLLWALDSPVCTATGVTAQRKFAGVEVEDLAMGILELENGALVEVCSSMDAVSEQAVTIELYGEKGTAIYRSSPLPHVRFLGRRVKKSRPPVWGLHALQRSLEAFRAWVMEDRAYLTPAAEALPVLAAIQGIYRSARSGRKESLA